MCKSIMKITVCKAEGLSGKFVPEDRKRYGLIPGVTDKDYYTNSFHIPVGYPISIKEKINIEVALDTNKGMLV